jgi:glycosyltransferase involved in cell wall biosynthesis
MKYLIEEPEFSIITPVFNGEKWISETIDSVLKTCAEYKFEYIVINDGSTDRTGEILSSYSKNIIVFNQENRGEAESVNTGLRIAKGSYVLVVSADDPMRSSMLLSLAREIFERNKNVVCAYPSWSVIDSHSQILRNVDVDEYSKLTLIGRHKCIVGPGGVFRRETALAIGGRRPSLKFTSDFDFWLRLSLHGEFIRIPGYLAYWREHELSTSVALRGVAMASERITVMEEFLDENAQLPDDLKRMAISSAYYQAARLVYFDRGIPGKKFLFRALYSYPANIFSFEWRVLLYIFMAPLSASLLKVLKRLGIFRKLPNNA